MTVDIGRFSGTFDWRVLTFPVDSKALCTLAELVSAQVHISLIECSGTLWVDMLQLEQKDHATPFTPTQRLPHDETLAL